MFMLIHGSLINYKSIIMPVRSGSMRSGDRLFHDHRAVIFVSVCRHSETRDIYTRCIFSAHQEAHSALRHFIYISGFLLFRASAFHLHFRISAFSRFGTSSVFPDFCVSAVPHFICISMLSSLRISSITSITTSSLRE